MLLSAVSVLVVAQSSSEIPEGLMNNPVFFGYKQFSGLLQDAGRSQVIMVQESCRQLSFFVIRMLVHTMNMSHEQYREYPLIAGLLLSFRSIKWSIKEYSHTPMSIMLSVHSISNK